MVRTPDALAAELLRLPAADRARLAEVLLASLDPDDDAEGAADVEAAWAAEAERRLAELRSGAAAGVPASDVFASARRRLGG
jgi:putative addiction module component (TIGR02574 family)